MPANTRTCTWPRSGSAATAGVRVSMIELRAAAKAIRAASTPSSARSARPASGRDRLTVDALDSVKTSYMGERPQPD